MSSACSFLALITCRRSASTSGCSNALGLPTQSAIVARSSSTPGARKSLPADTAASGRILRHQHVGQQPRPRHPARDRTARRLRLHDFVATPAGQFLAHLPDHHEARRNVFQHLRNVFAQVLQLAAAVRTRGVARQNLARLARQVRRQWPPLGFRCPRVFPLRSRRGRSGLFCATRFQLIQPQFQLLDLPGQLLRLAPELHPPQLGDQQLQMLDLRIARSQPLALQRDSSAYRSARAGKG